MSIFGKLDAASIPTNANFVEAGSYTAQVHNAYYSNNRDGDRQLVITYIIDDTDSEFIDSRVTQYFTLVDSDMTEEQFAALPGEEKQKIRKTNANIKRTLCGNDNYDDQPGLGVDYNDLNDEDWNPAVLKGTKVDLVVYNYGTNNQGVGVRSVNKIM